MNKYFESLSGLLCLRSHQGCFYKRNSTMGFRVHCVSDHLDFQQTFYLILRFIFRKKMHFYKVYSNIYFMHCLYIGSSDQDQRFFTSNALINRGKFICFNVNRLPYIQYTSNQMLSTFINTRIHSYFEKG